MYTYIYIYSLMSTHFVILTYGPCTLLRTGWTLESFWVCPRESRVHVRQATRRSYLSLWIELHALETSSSSESNIRWALGTWIPHPDSKASFYILHFEPLPNPGLLQPRIRREEQRPICPNAGCSASEIRGE